MTIRLCIEAVHCRMFQQYVDKNTDIDQTYTRNNYLGSIALGF